MIRLMISACAFALTPELTIAIATAALAIATVVLAGVTAWMALETRRTAKTTAKALELEQSPILGLRDVKVQVALANDPDQQSLAFVEVGIELFNAGRLPVRYNVKSLRMTFANRAAQFGEFLSRGATVLPGAVAVFWQGLPLQPPVSMFPATGRVRFEFEYSDNAGRQGLPIIGTVEYTVSAAAPGSPVSWRNIDEPSMV